MSVTASLFASAASYLGSPHGTHPAGRGTRLGSVSRCGAHACAGLRSSREPSDPAIHDPLPPAMPDRWGAARSVDGRRGGPPAVESARRWETAPQPGSARRARAVEGRSARTRQAIGVTLCLLLGIATPAFADPCLAPVAGSGLDSWPKCVDVTFTGQGVTGLPPLTYTWEVSNGYRFAGNPGTLHTENLDPGSYSAQLAVSNAYGTRRSLPVFFSIESLSPGPTPVWTNLGSRVVELQAQATGATEYQWVFGDGVTSAWIQGCLGRTVTHTYPAVGSYAARLRVRNCEDPQQNGAAFTITVTEEPQLAVLAWAAFCDLGFCIFDTGETVFFTTLVQGNPSTYSYDWDGDGLTDEVSAVPIASHVYHRAGTYLPRLTITRGTQVSTYLHQLPLVVLQASGPIFADGFESGTTAAWSLTVGEVRP